MRLVVLTDEALRKELLSVGPGDEIDFTWISNENDFLQHKSADGFIDLLFDGTQKRIELLRKLSPGLVVVNSVVMTQTKMHAPFVRINGWPGFLKRSIVEASNDDEKVRKQVENFFLFMNKKAEWLADEPGFVAARVIAMIINEAYLALGEQVSTKQDIDIAMKLGTNYPYGPFEWADQIGQKNLFMLLNEMCHTNARYAPAPILQSEALQ